jgi:hypothetical protein
MNGPVSYLPVGLELAMGWFIAQQRSSHWQASWLGQGANPRRAAAEDEQRRKRGSTKLKLLRLNNGVQIWDFLIDQYADADADVNSGG